MKKLLKENFDSANLFEKMSLLTEGQVGPADDCCSHILAPGIAVAVGSPAKSLTF